MEINKEHFCSHCIKLRANGKSCAGVCVSMHLGTKQVAFQQRHRIQWKSVSSLLQQFFKCFLHWHWISLRTKLLHQDSIMIDYELSKIPKDIRCSITEGGLSL